MIPTAPGARSSTAIALLCCALVGLAACGAPTAPKAATAPVMFGSVIRTVSATGALSGVSTTGPGSVAVIPFSESDAAMIRAGQSAQLTFDAIPGIQLHGRVVAVAPSAVAISGVTSYYVTIVLTDTDARLRIGQTVQASVVTASGQR
jgi:HlyD family secretion protein